MSEGKPRAPHAHPTAANAATPGGGASPASSASPSSPSSHGSVVSPTPTGDATAPIPSASILQGRDMISIEHNGRVYQLRKTRQGKLILTK